MYQIKRRNTIFTPIVRFTIPEQITIPQQDFEEMKISNDSRNSPKNFYSGQKLLAKLSKQTKTKTKY